MAGPRSVEDALADALSVLRDGGVVACATETQMGLLADAHNHSAVDRVLAVKGRSDRSPIALLLPDAEAMHAVARDVPASALALGRTHWPGPLTLVLWAREGLPHAVAPLGKVGVRVPGESPALTLVRAFGRAVTATSANRSGQPPAISAEEVEASLGAAVEITVPGRAPRRPAVHGGRHDDDASDGSAPGRRDNPPVLIRLRLPWRAVADIAPIRVRSLSSELLDDLGDTSQGVALDQARLLHYAQTFTPPGGGEPRTRDGLLALVRLAAPDAGVILAHERIFEQQSADRAREFIETRTSASPILLTYRDPTQTVRTHLRGGRRLAKFMTADGMVHAVAAVENPAATQAIVAALRNTSLIIADGHHRYAAARLAEAAIDAELGPTGGDPLGAHHFVPALLIDEGDPGLVIAPTHRLVSAEAGDDVARWVGAFPEWFEVHPLGVVDCASAQARLTAVPAERPAFVYMPREGVSLLCVARADRDLRRAQPLAELPALLRDLDVSVLHGLVLNDVERTSSVGGQRPTALRYIADTAKASAALAADGAALFLLRPPTMAQVRAVAEAGLHMPHKSTAFYPKARPSIASHLLEPTLRVGTF